MTKNNEIVKNSDEQVAANCASVSATLKRWREF